MAITNNASFSFRMTEGLKREAFSVIEQYGFTPSQVLNLFLTEIAKTKTVPLNLSYLEPNETTLRAMAEIESGTDEIIPLPKGKEIIHLLNDCYSEE